MKTLLPLLTAMMLMAALSKAAFADAGKIEKLRKFYKAHNLDYFGELIAGEEDLHEAEKRHAKIELLADDARTKALAQLEQLMPRAKGPMQAELLMRKATLLSDRARTAVYFQNNPFKASKLKSSEFYLKASIDAFSAIERGFPTHPRLDAVLFSIAYNYGELKNVERSFAYYLKLVNKYPDSQLAGDARLAIAEIHFDKRRFGEALSQLREIVKAEHPRLKNFALYKMAWTYYNMADLESAINALEKVIDGVNQATGVQHARLELRKEALHDLVVYYADHHVSGSAARATEYFEKIAKTPEAIAAEYAQAREKRLAAYKAKNVLAPQEESEEYRLSEAQELLFRLVQVYRDHGQHENSMTVAGQLISKLERHPRVVALYRLRAESAEKLRRRDLVLSELERFAKVLERDLPVVSEFKNGLPETTRGSLAETIDKSAEPKVTLAAEAQAPADQHKESAYLSQLAKIGHETFNDFTTFLHGEWSKTQSVETARQALAAYDLAIKVLMQPWRGTPLEGCFELISRRAQLRFALKSWDGAAQDYHFLASHKPKPEDALVDNLRGEITSLESLLKDKPVAPQAKADIHPVHQRLLSAYDAFLSHFVFNSKQRAIAAGVHWAAANLYKEYGQGAEALRRLMFYSRHFNDQKEAVPATRDVLALLAAQERWEELRDYSERLLEKGFYKNAPVEKEISKSLEYAQLKLLETLEKTQDWGKAEKEFAVFARKNPQSTFASQALLKSANAAIQTGDAEASLKRLEDATNATDSNIKLQAWLGLEPLYRKAFQWTKLSSLYEAVLSLKADAKTKAGATTNLASVRELADETFMKKGSSLIDQDKAVSALTGLDGKFEAQVAPFKAMRFVKSNNNPQQNFKKKADLHAKLTQAAEKLAETAPASLKAPAQVWANLMKAELLAEFAETLETAALPAVLKAATDADRKAYSDTLSVQAKDLRLQGAEIIRTSAKKLTEIDCPVALEDRFNRALERLGEPTRLARQSLAKLWAQRPGHGFKATEAKAADLGELGVKILRAQKKEDSRGALLKLAQLYRKGSMNGFAYATASEVTASDDEELKARALVLQLEIDFDRLPRELVRNIESDRLSAQERWDLARWIAGRSAQLKKAGADKVLGSAELSWFEQFNGALLRVEAREASVIQANAK